MSTTKTVGYPNHARTVDSCVAQMKELFTSDEFRVTRFSMNVITPEGHKLKLEWDASLVKEAV